MWHWHQNSCYYFATNEEKTWSNSRKNCMDKNSTLVKIDSVEEKVRISFPGYRNLPGNCPCNVKQINSISDPHSRNSVHFEGELINGSNVWSHLAYFCNRKCGSHIRFFLFSFSAFSEVPTITQAFFLLVGIIMGSIWQKLAVGRWF